MIDEWEVPRCSHGRIILACPDDACPEQNAYLAEQEAALDGWWARQVDEARRLVRAAVGLPVEEQQP